MAKHLIRAQVRQMAPYQPIRPFEVLSAELGRPPEEIVKLDANGDTDPTFVAEAQARTTALAVASDGSALGSGVAGAASAEVDSARR